MKTKEREETRLTRDDITLVPWDASEFLDNHEMIEAYLNEAFATGDTEIISCALGDIAKAVGMTEIARKSGMNRQNLYRALSAGSNPRLETVLEVVKALGCKLAVA